MNKQTSQAKNSNAEKSEGGIFSKVTTTLRTWFDLFMGRPRYRKPEMQGTAKINRESKAISPAEDSVTKDIKNVFGFISKIFGQASQKVTPTNLKVGKGVPQVPLNLSNNGLFVKVIRIFLIIVFLMVIVFIGVRIFSLMQENGEEGGVRVYISPTPVPYKPSKPSVYAEDEFILNLEEKIRVLEREVAGISVRETTLTPPILDFNVDFED